MGNKVKHRYSDNVLLSEYILENTISNQVSYEVAVNDETTNNFHYKYLIKGHEFNYCGEYDFDQVICRSLEHEQSVFVNVLKNSIKTTKQLFIGIISK